MYSFLDINLLNVRFFGCLVPVSRLPRMTGPCRLLHTPPSQLIENRWLLWANSVEKLKVFAALYVRRMCSRLCFTLPLWLELALEPTWLAF